jgi:hypothetical protein
VTKNVDVQTRPRERVTTGCKFGKGRLVDEIKEKKKKDEYMVQSRTRASSQTFVPE